MRAYLPDYELRVPATLEDALRIIADEPGVWKPFAGGTDLMVLLDAGTLTHKRYIDLWNLPELRGITVTGTELVAGALTTYADVLRNATMSVEFPLMCRAASETGSIATQNRGTLGGNIANASPAADTPPALLVYDAVLELASVRGIRTIQYRDFHTGYKKMDLGDDEIVARIRLPRGRSGWREEYRKVGTRRAQAISKVCFAAGAKMSANVIEDVRIAFGSVAPTVVRCTHTEATLLGRPLGAGTSRSTLEALTADLSPINDLRSTARYRQRVAQNLLSDFLARLADP
ncbi:MAG TPA: xanthine dehydrogenase family protein subunit M [Vicinamibacterales bacterium]|nr:xanthine dehydrogenase family protein subunit M [Vicinamibacterales bacterium]